MMKKIKKICVISQGYPTKDQPWFSFVDQLLCAFTNSGIECTVICPQSSSKTISKKVKKRPLYWEKEYKESIIKIYQPSYISFSNLHLSNYYFSDISFENAVIRQFQKIKNEFDVIYGHFWQCGMIAAKISKMYEIPAFVACGESTIPYEKLINNLKYLKYIKGVICVSTKIKKRCLELGLCNDKNSEIFPNAIDETIFYPRDKHITRKKLDISDNAFVVSFVGSFTNRKGSLRLSKALDAFKDVYSIFIGSGPEAPTCSNRLFTGSLPHEDIADYLCASDIFVLPTTNEGCCNAIIEAMACGLPIISSNDEFNDDILNDNNSIRIDPMAETEIIEAIRNLKENPELLRLMSLESIKISSRLSIHQRSQNIIGFMENRI